MGSKLRRAILLASLVGALGLPAARSESPSEDFHAQPPAEQITIFLVRHAEPIYPPPEDAPRDPQLNVMGQDRAEALARLLASAGIDRILSSDYHRTRETAAPLAELLGLEVELYDPGDLGGLAEALLDRAGTTLVAGHSNTTPELVGRLGGEPGDPIDETSEFDRLYVLTGSRDNGLSTVVLRYGEAVRDDWKQPAAERP